MFKNNITSDLQLNQMMATYPGFLGTFPIDEIPYDKLNKNQLFSFIVNMEPSYKSGSHWVAVFNPSEPKNNYVDYWDSFGIVPPTQIQQLKKLKPIMYNTSPIQNIKSTACGYYAVYFLKERYKGRKYLDIVYDFNQKFNTFENEKKIEAKRDKLIKEIFN